MREEPLLTAIPEFRDAAAGLAEGSDNLSMAYTSKASEIRSLTACVIQNLLYKTEGYGRAIELGNKLVNDAGGEARAVLVSHVGSLWTEASRAL